MSSKGKGRTLELEQIRKAEERAAAESAEVRKKGVLTIVAIVAVIGAVAAWIALAPPPPGIPFPSQGNVHLSDITDAHATYNSSPPSSGPHLGILANWGVAESAIPPELYIHNLEDAGIVLAYNCPDGCDDLTAELESIVEENSGERLLMTPYEAEIVDPDGTTYRAAAVAWGRVLYFDSAADARGDINDFISIYEGIDHHATSAPTHG